MNAAATLAMMAALAPGHTSKLLGGCPYSVEFLKKEYPLIKAKKSELSAKQRAIVVYNYELLFFKDPDS